MASRSRVLVSLAVSSVLCVSPVWSASTPKTGAAWPKGAYSNLNALPDWGGVWVLVRPRPPGPNEPPRDKPTLKGEYLARYESWQKQVRDNAGLVKKDNSNCMPPGMPYMLGTGQYPIEFLFTPGRVTVLHEAWMQWRSIWTDGRKHPDDHDPGFFGHSIGRWEGSSLVVDTVGIKTITELAQGMKHSEALRVSERIYQDTKDPETLYFEVTMDDPLALERPYRVTHTYKRQRDWNLMEFVCAENDRNPVDGEGNTVFK